MGNPIKVFIVDDSAVVRSILTERLNAAGGILVVGSAPDPFIAREKLAKNPVDVMILDIEMPRMDGLTFLKHLMKSYPIPTIVLSSLVGDHNQASLKALELGAVEVLRKPGGPYSVGELLEDLVVKIRMASLIRMDTLRDLVTRVGANRVADAPRRDAGGAKMLAGIRTSRQLIAVGASTGGTIAMEKLFTGFSTDFPPALGVIHMPERFTASFSKRLDDLCLVRVKEAEAGETPLMGHVYIAPGNKHMAIRMDGAKMAIEIMEGPKVHNQRPAVDILFRSVARHLGQNGIGVLMTGMGRDGADGLLQMKEAGAYTITQDEESCIVYGMPKEAVTLGASMIQLPLDGIAAELRRRVAESH